MLRKPIQTLTATLINWYRTGKVGMLRKPDAPSEGRFSHDDFRKMFFKISERLCENFGKPPHRRLTHLRPFITMTNSMYF